MIYPPVNVERIQSVADWRSRLTPSEAGLLESLPAGFLLGASRFIPYKRLQDVIRVGEATRRPVVLAGEGPSLRALQEAASAANVPVRFVAAPSEALQVSRAHATCALDALGSVKRAAMNRL